MIKKIMAILFCVIYILMTPSILALAENVPYSNYVYNEWGSTVEVPAAYIPKRLIDSAHTGYDQLIGASDFMFDRSTGYIYVVDTSRNRIVVLDKKFKLVKVLEEFIVDGDQSTTLNLPKGIFVHPNGLLYIADTENNRILVTDKDGNVVNQISRPVSELYPENYTFMPEKIVVDTKGIIYLQVRDMFIGLVCLNSEGDFLQYFGSNRVNVTAQVLLEQFWKSFMTYEQRRSMVQFVPVEYSNMHIDSEDFIYTSVSYAPSSINQLQKLNSKGNNILNINQYNNTSSKPPNNYGDYPSYYSVDSSTRDTTFADIHYTDDEVILGLDSQRGRIFAYDDYSNLLYLFGSRGNQIGTFESPSALESFGRSIYVLDAGNGYITEFEPTEYGNKIMDATLLYNRGEYDESFAIWQDVLNRNINFNIAYIGIARIEQRLGNYESAMEYFKLGFDKKGYSDARTSYQTQSLRDRFIFVIPALIILAFFPYILSFLLKKANKKFAGESGYPHKNLMPLYTIKHPVDGFEYIKWKKYGSYIAGIFLISIWVLSNVMIRQGTGFAYNSVDPSTVKISEVLIITVGVIMLLIGSNWLVCPFMQGEGKFKDIFSAFSYATIILTFRNVLYVILTQFVPLEASAFIVLLNAVFYIWFAGVLFVSIMAIHDFTFGNTILNLIFTGVGATAISLLLLLLYSLFQQVLNFFVIVFNEIMFRL